MIHMIISKKKIYIIKCILEYRKPLGIFYTFDNTAGFNLLDFTQCRTV